MRSHRPARLSLTLAAIAVLFFAVHLPAAAHELEDDTRRIAVVSAFAPEMSILREATEDAAVAHVAWANSVPFIAVRSLSDLAGGSEQANQLEVFFRLAADNAATVVRGLLRSMAE